MISLDALRAKYPQLGFALYAFEPGQPVVLECINQDGRSFKFTGATAEAAMLAGFGDDFAPEPMPPTPEPAAPTPTTSVFD